MRPRLATFLVPIAGLVLTTSLAACSLGNDYYHRAAYINDKKIDPGLAHAEQEMTDWLASGDALHVLLDRTARPWSKRMAHFLRGYAGHPVVIARIGPGDDNTADETLLVTCRPGHVQHVSLTWGWFDGAWRALPDYMLTAAGKAVEYPGCR